MRNRKSIKREREREREKLAIQIKNMEPRSSGFVKRLVIEILLVRIQVADIC